MIKYNQADKTDLSFFLILAAEAKGKVHPRDREVAEKICNLILLLRDGFSPKDWESLIPCVLRCSREEGDDGASYGFPDFEAATPDDDPLWQVIYSIDFSDWMAVRDVLEVVFFASEHLGNREFNVFQTVLRIW